MASAVSHKGPIALYPGQPDQERAHLKARYRQYELRAVERAESYFQEQQLTSVRGNRSKGDTFFNRYRFFRLISRIIRKFFPSRVHITIPHVDREDKPVSPVDPGRRVLVSDAMLLDSLGHNRNDCRVIGQHDKPLFNMGGQGLPEQRDVMQSDRRDTCGVLSSALAYCRTENGRKRFRQLFKDNGDNTVTVNLWNTYKGETVSIVVSKDRPLTRSGHDVYSFSNTSNVLWPGLFEKAVHGLRLLMLSQMDEDKNSADTKISKGAKVERPQLLSDRKKNVLDYINIFEGLRYLPPIGSDWSAGRGARVRPVNGFNGTELKQVKEAVREGRPVVLGRNLSCRNIMNALTSGIIVNHAVAVLGAANCDGEEGVLIRDPYGSKINNNGEVRLLTGQSIEWRQGDDGIQFIPWRRMSDYFDEAAEIVETCQPITRIGSCSSLLCEDSPAVVDLQDDDLSDFEMPSL